VPQANEKGCKGRYCTELNRTHGAIETYRAYFAIELGDTSGLPRSGACHSADTVANFPRDFPVRLLPGIPAHQRQGLAHLLIGNNIQCGD
jgi:hypothetical protein